MRKLFPCSADDSVDALMSRIGYTFHCTHDGRPCYHRRLNDPRFPRFHAYVSRTHDGIAFDLHFDALDSIQHKGNHDQSWAYEGGRVYDEMRRVTDVLEGQPVSKVSGTQNLHKLIRPKPPKKTLLDLFLG